MAEGKIKFCQARPPEAKELAVPVVELFVMQMSRAFGSFPVELGKDNLERLEGMASTWTDVSVNPFEAMARAIKRYGFIRVWREHESVREILEAEAQARRDGHAESTD